MTKLEIIKEKLEKISPKDLDMVDYYIDNLIPSKKSTRKRKFRFDWKGALKDEKISSVELQHKILEEWSNLD